MLIRYKVISIFCLVDDTLNWIQYEKDKRRKVSDSEVGIKIFVSAICF